MKISMAMVCLVVITFSSKLSCKISQARMGVSESKHTLARKENVDLY